MEQFKICEKTKAFSKERSQVNQDDIKSESRAWIGRCLKDLSTQIEQFEVEIDQEKTKKKPDPARIKKLTEGIKKHEFHSNQLERVLRNLENDTITNEQVILNSFSSLYLNYTHEFRSWKLKM